MESEQIRSSGSGTGSSPFKIWAPPCGIAVLILLFSSLPGAYYPEHPDFLNNGVHILEFGLLAFLLARALHHGYSIPGWGLFLWTTAVCITFGLLDEAHQFLVPERVFDLMDLLFDTIGAATGSGFYIFLSTFEKGITGSGSASSGDLDA